jgi:glycogen debranching enzyme
VHGGVIDPAVRPNMVVAAALPRSPWTLAQRAGVVQKAAAELLTPRGLRTLSPRDPAYRGRYEGGIDARDLAYHQGTVWPWLAGFYVEAALRGGTSRPRSKVAELRDWLAGFLPELDRAGLDHVSEVFDGDEPQRPGGTFAQAWNSGELLRALWLCEQPARLDPRGTT